MFTIAFVDNHLATDPTHSYVAHVTEQGQETATVELHGIDPTTGWQGAVQALAAQLGGGAVTPPEPPESGSADAPSTPQS